MSKLLFSALQYNFPYLFRDLSYIQCHDGWFELVWQMCQTLSTRFTIQEMSPFAQIKEKYGVLRVYFDWADEDVFDTILRFEKLSEKRCEECGDNGVLRFNRRYYIQTLCDNCSAIRT